MKKTFISVALLLLVIAILLPNVASAASVQPSVTVSDSDPRGDVDSRLDLVFEKFVGNGDGTATLKLRTARRWSCRYIERNVANGDNMTVGLLWLFDTDRDGDFGDLSGLFRCHRGNFSFDFARGPRPDASFPARKPDPRTIVVKIDLSMVGSTHAHLRAASRVQGVEHGALFLEEYDYAPALKAY